MPQITYGLTGVPGTTTKIASTDTASTLATLGVTIEDHAIGALITCETNGIRFAFNATPDDDAGTALGHVLAADESLYLSNPEQINDLKVVSKTAASAAVLQVTLYKRY